MSCKHKGKPESHALNATQTTNVPEKSALTSEVFLCQTEERFSRVAVMRILSRITSLVSSFILQTEGKYEKSYQAKLFPPK